MKLKKLEIRRTESYDKKPLTLQGLVTLQGETGQQDIVLSPGAISRLINIIADEVVVSARNNARMVANSMQEASDEILLLDQDGKIE